MKYKRKKRRMSGLDKYVIFCIVALLLYTIAQTIIMLKTGQEASTLTTCFFAAFGGEFLLCALIKIFKIKDKEDKGDECNTIRGIEIDRDDNRRGGGDEGDPAD